MNILIATPSRGAKDYQHQQCLDELFNLARQESVKPEPAYTLSITHIWQCSLLDLARSIIASDFVRGSWDVLCWLDDDMTFEPEELLTLCKASIQHKAIVGAAASTKRPQGDVTAVFLEGTKSIKFFEEGSVIEVKSIGTGVTAVHRSVFQAIIENGLETCIAPGNIEVWPFYHSLIQGRWHGEDTSFCIRAQQAGKRVMVDTRMRVGHIGRYVYQLEDTGNAVPLYRTLQMNLDHE